MARRSARPGVLLLAVGLFAQAAAAQTPAGSPPTARSLAAVEAEWAARLVSLSPDQPEGYLALAEEVEDEGDDAAPLGRRLHVLAFELARGRGDRALAVSACLALADLSPLGRDRDWLQALAGSFGWIPPPEARELESTTPGEGLAYRTAVFLGAVRAGDPGARSLAEDPAIRAVVRRFERLMSRSGASGEAAFVLREAGDWLCSECRNRRISRKALSSPPEYRLCAVCGGDPGPRLSEEDLVAQLRFESRLLHGLQKSWAAQAVLDRGAPLRDPDPSDLAPTLGVDPALVLYREGRWVARPVPQEAVPAPAAEAPREPEEQPRP